MKKKIASTKMIALTPERRMVASSSLSATISAAGRRGRAAPPATKPPLMAPPAGAPAEGGSGPAAPAPRDASTASSAATLPGGQRHVAVLFEDALAGWRQDPLDVALDLALRLAERVDLKGAGQRVALVERVGDRGRDRRRAGLGLELQHLDGRRGVAHAAVADRGLRVRHQLDDLLGAAHVARPELEVLLVEHVLAKELVGARAGLAADADDLIVRDARDLDPELRPLRDVAAFGEDLGELVEGDLVGRVVLVDVD